MESNIYRNQKITLIQLIVFILIFTIKASATHPHGKSKLSPWEKHPELFAESSVIWLDSIGPDYSLLYKGAKYNGKDTYVFAYYSVPENIPGKIPAIVLAHGGGGKAFQNWAKQWAEYGYAAIAMNLYGEDNNGNRIGFLRHPDTDHNFNVKKSGLEESWHYQASAAIICAVSFLESRAEVDKDRIGIMGISWGGYNASAIVGVDERLSAAIIVYGCGDLYKNSIWKREKYKFSKAYKHLLDPANYLPQANLPILWINNNTDHFYPLDSFQASRKLTIEKGYARIHDNYHHGYETPWNTEDIHKFADAFLKCGDPWPKIVDFGLDNDQIWAETENIYQADSAWVVYTTNPNWMYCSSRIEGDDVWITRHACIDKKIVRAQVPEQAVAVYLHVKDKNKREFSTDYINLSGEKQDK